MSEKKRLSPIFAEAMALPTAAYREPKPSDIEKAMLTEMGSHALTNATSRIPIIGTFAFNPCAAVIVFNTKTKTAFLEHTPIIHDLLEPMLDKVRTNHEDPVDLHVMGEAISTKKANNINKYSVEDLVAFLENFKRAKNVTLKTFDVYTKPKPHAVALDTRDGQLIKGSALFTAYEQGVSIRDNFSYWRRAEGNQSFDGTVPDMQIG